VLPGLLAGAGVEPKEVVVAELPSGTVTFLFTDLEGSTRLWEEHPNAMRAALALHDELMRRAIESHDGSVVKTTGDGFFAVFATAGDAVDAAIDAQLALAAEAWPETGPLRGRMAVHTGVAEMRRLDRTEPAFVLLAEAYERLTEGFATADLMDARRLLDDLAAAS
jgi:class 3 adenylate cyclase